MERFLVAGRDWPPAVGLPRLYSAIVGAPRCMRRGARCDLSRGIETNVLARTITIHLSRPDGDLLHKLTMHFASVVPADSPDRPTRGLTPPGTGPYRPVAWDARRGGTFVRNRYFRSDPARSRGEGFADRIEVRVHSKRTIEREIGAVQRGDADLAVLADPFGPLVSEGRLRALVARSPGQVRSAPAPTTDWAFLNTRRRPFDDIRVRRALNLAIDRAKVVALSGGPEVGEPTCQVVPANFQGNAPYCPDTASPAKGGGWTAPDMAQARRLVAASGRAGERVVVRVPDFREAVGRHVAKVLNKLGFRTTVRVLSFNDPGGTPGRRSALPAGWPTTSARRPSSSRRSRARNGGRTTSPISATRGWNV